MKKNALSLGMCFLTFCAPLAQAVEPKEKAIRIAMRQFERFGKDITELPLECVSFVEPAQDSSPFLIDLREKHGASCGGDPNTAPRISTLKVDLRSGDVLAQDPLTGEFKSLAAQVSESSGKHVPHVMERAQCRLGDKAFEIVLLSASGVPAEDDMTLWFVQDGRKTALRQSPNWLEFFTPLPVVQSLCRRGTAVSVRGGNALTIISSSGRPGLDHLEAVVYDPVRYRILATKELGTFYLGSDRSEAIFKPLTQGISALVVSAQPNDGPEGMVQAWLDVSFDGTKITTRWE